MAGVFANTLETITELSTLHALQYLGPVWDGVPEQLQKLRISLLFIQPLVEDAEERQLTDQAVRCWLLLLKDAIYDSEDVLDEAKTHELLLIHRKAELSGRPRSKVRGFFSLDHNPLLFKLQLGKKLRKVNERIDRLIKEMHKFNLRAVENNNKKLLRNRPQTYSYVHESRVIGRDEDKKKLVQMLISDCFEEKIAVVSIVGMGGLGKTTLAQLVYRDEEVQKHFELHIWVCVSDDFDLPKLAAKIIHTASEEICDHTNMEVLQQHLRKVLEQKKYLLVLDDVWNEDFQKWDALRNMLLDGGEGSRILVTTRNEKCSRVMGAQKHHILRGLSEKSSWALFEKKAFAIGAPKQPKLVEIGEKIVKKCQGLPLAVEVLGCIMSCKSEESEWQAVLENETWKLQHTENKIIPELWLSYVDLPTHLKKCFAFCAILPKDDDIVEGRLIQFWMAQGFIPSQNGKGNDMNVEGRDVFTELIRRSLLQNDYSLDASKYGRVCKMHHLIHDLALFVMENECFPLLKSSPTTKIPRRPRHLNLQFDENYNQGDCSIIHTVLYCQRDYRLLSKLKLVRVLDLSEADIEELPASIEHLHHLRYLDISFTGIRKLPESICMLVNLQTLNLYGCYELSKLPKSITYMDSLRHLLIDYWPEFEALPPGLHQLQNLKSLTAYTVEVDAENNIGQLKSLNLFGELALYNLQKVKNADDARKANLGNKQHIHILKLSWGDDECCSMENAKEVLEALKPHGGVKELIVSHYPGKQFPMWMRERQQFQYLHHLELLKCRACEQLPPLEILPCLESLKISKLDGIKHIVNNRRGNALQLFPALKTLELESMKNLEGWCVEEGREENQSLFPRLTFINITKCPKLTTALEILPCLEDLFMYEMDGIKHIVNNRGGNALQSFPALKNLTLSGLRNLEGWCVEEGSEANLSLFPHLTFIHITRCPKLTTPLEILPSLEHLIMIEMDGIKHIVHNRRSNTLQSFQALKILELKSMKNLEGWCVEEDRESNLSLFPCLIRMDIRGCPKLTTLLLEILPCLESLKMHEMDGIKHIVNSKRSNALQPFPALKTLVLKSMKNLEWWYLEEGREANLSLFPCLIHMDITGCPKLTTMPPIPTLEDLVIIKSFCETQISVMPTERRFFKHLKSLRSLRINSCSQELVSLLEDEDETTAMKSSLEKLCIADCNQLSLTFVLRNLSSLRYLNVSYCNALRELPICPKSLQSLIIDNCPGIKCLSPEMGHLTSLFYLWLSECPKLVSLSDGMQGLTSLESLHIQDCPMLKSFPEGLQQLLPSIKSLTLQGCPELERLCKLGGDYYNLLSPISYKQIGIQPKQTTQVPSGISSSDKQALKWTTTNPFLLSAMFICAIACFIYVFSHKLHSQSEQDFCYIPPT
ncbi:putative disease resistance protein RGA3 [Dioscorea cayenensis subsp. rotundata]|uniref:Disease resistance protein RGA3 n=1 Tax=Dioscorea cayennensis subsp. rotundata TaxID=55577 RepID=A0AB40CCF0_DIOCR|nr:putative disease resistance protein RGA3 [Dioscorea cayenensis subsp. rotundata]